MRNDVVEEKTSESHVCAIECGHGFCPLCEIVNSDDDVMIPSYGCRFLFHKLYGPFAKGLAVITIWGFTGGACIFDENTW